MKKPTPFALLGQRYEQDLQALRAAIETAYDLRPTGKPIDWTGSDIDADAIRTESSIHDRFSPEGLAYDAERGRDALEVILDVAMRLGEQRGCEECHEVAYKDALVLKWMLWLEEVSMPPNVRKMFAEGLERLANPGGVGEQPRKRYHSQDSKSNT